MKCKYCNTDVATLGQISRPESNGADKLLINAQLINPEYIVEKDVGYEFPCISVVTLAGESAYLLPELLLKINYCPICGRKLI